MRDSPLGSQGIPRDPRNYAFSYSILNLLRISNGDLFPNILLYPGLKSESKYLAQVMMLHVSQKIQNTTLSLLLL